MFFFFFMKFVISHLNVVFCFFFQQFSFDKKLVPKQFARTIKTLSSSVDKRWILCPVLSWDELVKVKDIQSNGIKKNSDPYLIGEYLISLLRDLAPICSFENFEPKESFVGKYNIIFKILNIKIVLLKLY